MKKALLEMEDQRSSYEQKAKESLQKVLEEKMSAEQQLQSAQVETLCGPGAGTLGTVPRAGGGTHSREHTPQIHPAF